MRKEIEDRYYKVMTYQQVDRVPDFEFGYWPQTIRRWLREGMKVELNRDEQNEMFSWKVDQFMGFEGGYHGWLPVHAGMNPGFEQKVIERRSHSIIEMDSSGCLAEKYLNDQEDSSIPHFIEFPVKTPKDWESMKERYRIDDPVRAVKTKDIERTRKDVAEGKMITINCPGPYGMLRAWMGFENLSLAFYEYPEMIHDMIDHMTELVLHQLRQIPLDIAIDHSSWWEDMASRNGPFVGPVMFREFLQPQYHRIQEELKKHGVVIGIVDCDGNPHDIVGNWIEEGVNIMFPAEVAAGCDMYAWRREFGKELRLRGGIAKTPLVEGGKAIDRELERIKPMLDQGGYIPHLDHLVPPDISFKNYMDYLDKKRKLIGKC
ncbi:MAG: uroporphyrinogen decarboxylase family protein [bacterium]